MNMLAQWEDEENHRQIQFSIEYTIESSAVVLDELTPVKVTMICPKTNTVLRSVGVHTQKGKSMISDQFARSGKLDDLIIAIGEKHDLVLTAE
jgi:hypothetical protein